MAKLIKIVGYAHWASFLVNGDPSGLTEEEFAECQTWLAYHRFSDHDVAGCTGEGEFTTPDFPGALLGTCVTYHFHPRQK